MTAATVVPDLPSEYSQSTDPFLRVFDPVINTNHQTLVRLSGEFERVREAQNRAEQALEDSDHPDAEAYRAAKESTDEVVESLESDRDAEIKRIRQEYSAKIKDAKSELNSLREVTLKTVAADSVSDVDVTTLVAEYTTAFDAVKTTAKALADKCPELWQWAKKLPSRVSQATGGNGNSGTVRGFTPRFTSIVVDDSETPAKPTLSETAKMLGLGAGGRKLLIQQLLGSIGTPENLSTDSESPSVFYIDNNGKQQKIAVVGTAAKESEEDSE